MPPLHSQIRMMGPSIGLIFGVFVASAAGTTGTFSILIQSASNLPDTDWGIWTTIDPYVVVHKDADISGNGGTECGRTTTKWDDENPTWNKQISCGTVESTSRIAVFVFC